MARAHFPTLCIEEEDDALEIQTRRCCVETLPVAAHRVRKDPGPPDVCFPTSVFPVYPEWKGAYFCQNRSARGWPGFRRIARKTSRRKEFAAARLELDIPSQCSRQSIRQLATCWPYARFIYLGANP